MHLSPSNNGSNWQIMLTTEVQERYRLEQLVKDWNCKKFFFVNLPNMLHWWGVNFEEWQFPNLETPPWHTRRLAAGRRPENSGRSEPYNNSLIPSQIWKEPPRLHCHSSRTQSALAFLFTCTVVPSKRKSWEHELYHLEAHRSIFP